MHVLILFACTWALIMSFDQGSLVGVCASLAGMTLTCLINLD
jgi:uncharacterized membrane protein